MRAFRNKVLITDPGGCRGALLVVRSLRKRNIETSLLDHMQERNVSRFSRWRPKSIYSPSPINDMKGFITALTRHVSSGRYFTIFPVTDPTLLPISEYRKQLAPYLRFVLPSHESVMTAFDKSKTIKLAQEIGVPIPKTFHVENTSEAINVSEKIRYPAVIKPRQSYTWGKDGQATLYRPFYVNSAPELISTYKEVEQKSPSPLVQEYVPGYNISVAVLFEHGELKAACFIGVKRTIPVRGGNSVLRESIPLDPTLLRYTQELLSGLCWHGVAEVEYRIDSRDLAPKLMEINARIWGSMNVAIESGVDFPYLLYLLATGESIEPVFKYKIGVKYRWLNADVQNLISIIKNKQRLINTENYSKLNAILDFLKFYETNMHYDGFTLSDPMPFFMDEALSIYDVAKRFCSKRI
ncbi:MAG: carboxylate--amine ligase [Candidatus Sifarchaeia archaeon]